MDYRDANTIERDRVSHYSRTFGGSAPRRVVRHVPTFEEYFSGLSQERKKRNMRDIRAEYNVKYKL
jgi:hypothetical protein